MADTQPAQFTPQQRALQKLNPKLKAAAEEMEALGAAFRGEKTIQALDNLKDGDRGNKSLTKLYDNLPAKAVDSLKQIIQEPPPELKDFRKLLETSESMQAAPNKYENARDNMGVLNAAIHIAEEEIVKGEPAERGKWKDYQNALKQVRKHFAEADPAMQGANLGGTADYLLHFGKYRNGKEVIDPANDDKTGRLDPKLEAQLIRNLTDLEKDGHELFDNTVKKKVKDLQNDKPSEAALVTIGQKIDQTVNALEKAQRKRPYYQTQLRALKDELPNPAPARGRRGGRASAEELGLPSHVVDALNQGGIVHPSLVSLETASNHLVTPSQKKPGRSEEPNLA